MPHIIICYYNVPMRLGFFVDDMFLGHFDYRANAAFLRAIHIRHGFAPLRRRGRREALDDIIGLRARRSYYF